MPLLRSHMGVSLPAHTHVFLHGWRGCRPYTAHALRLKQEIPPLRSPKRQPPVFAPLRVVNYPPAMQLNVSWAPIALARAGSSRHRTIFPYLSDWFPLLGRFPSLLLATALPPVFSRLRWPGEARMGMRRRKKRCEAIGSKTQDSHSLIPAMRAVREAAHGSAGSSREAQGCPGRLREAQGSSGRPEKAQGAQ